MISAQGMMHPELLRKLVLNNFCEYSLQHDIQFYFVNFIWDMQYLKIMSGYLKDICYSHLIHAAC